MTRQILLDWDHMAPLACKDHTPIAYSLTLYLQTQNLLLLIHTCLHTTLLATLALTSIQITFPHSTQHFWRLDLGLSVSEAQSELVTSNLNCGLQWNTWFFTILSTCLTRISLLPLEFTVRLWRIVSYPPLYSSKSHRVDYMLFFVKICPAVDLLQLPWVDHLLPSLASVSSSVKWVIRFIFQDDYRREGFLQLLSSLWKCGIRTTSLVH